MKFFIHIYQPLRSGWIWHKVNFWAKFNRFWIQSFPSPRLVVSIRLEEPSLPYYLPMAGGRIIGFIHFPRVLVLCEIQSVLSRIWTRVAVSISCEDNHYTTGTSMWNLFICRSWIRFRVSCWTYVLNFFYFYYLNTYFFWQTSTSCLHYLSRNVNIDLSIKFENTRTLKA